MAHLTGRMIDRTKKLPARFYVSPTGRNPVREWILELPSEDRQTVGKDIQKVEAGQSGVRIVLRLGTACGRYEAILMATGSRG
jgi:hypothetical protein